MPPLAALADADKPRERFMAKGSDTLSDADLLAIALRASGLRGRSVHSVAEEILSRHNGLQGVARAHWRALCRIPGIGPAKAVTLAAAFELARRVAKEDRSRATHLKSAKDVAGEFGGFFLGKSREIFRIVLLDRRARVLASPIVARGTEDRVNLTPRKILTEALAVDAAGMILMHNHPSGDPAPSAADRDLTVRIRAAAREVGVEVWDHVVFGRAGEWAVVK